MQIFNKNANIWPLSSAKNGNLQHPILYFWKNFFSAKKKIV